jgi:amino acid adenylation domain-containing protein
VTYAGLDSRANRVACALRRRGVGPETLVGLAYDRSIEFVVAMIAIHKAGGAYVPLDPAYPPGRVRFMIEDSSIRLVLADRRLGLEAAGVDVVEVVELESEAASDECVTERLATPANAAYVIYTSGTTGVPKGVVLEHLGLCNLVEQKIRTFLTRDSRVLQFASTSFDSAVSEIYQALGCGATLVLAERERLAPGPELVELLRRERVTNATLPPSALAQLPPDELPELRVVMTAGEACPTEVAAAWSRGRRLYNGYGPSEATVGTTLAELDGTRKPPIGRPISNKRVYVLDERLRPVPPGSKGELYVGGIGVARGYIGRPELTAERFLPDPFADEPGARMYRTGDAVRWDADGQLHFLGRIDGQVKIRGFRIELAEVEAALEAVEGVHDAVVVARGEGASAELVSYYVPVASPPSPAELKAALRTVLPDFMLPRAYVALERFPLTANGKIDRAALPEPGADDMPRAAHVAPRDNVERELVRIWEDVLGTAPIGVLDDFFEVGGHSLLATQVVSRIRARLGVRAEVRLLFESPTVAGLAPRVAGLAAEPVAAIPSRRRQPPS